MEFTLDAAFSPQGMLGHSAYLLLVASMLMRSMLYLRLLVIASAIVGISYTTLVLHDPVSTFWESALITANLIQIFRVWYKDRRARFSPEELAMAEIALRGLKPAQRRELLDCGAWKDLAPGTVLTRENEPADTLSWLSQGRAQIVICGKAIGSVDASAPTRGEFIGEFSTLTGGGATATVTISHSARIWAIDAAKVRTITASGSPAGTALSASLARDMRKKLLRANTWMAISPRPVARSLEAICGQRHPAVQ